MDQVWAPAIAGVVVGTGLPWALKTISGLVRGAADRADAREERGFDREERAVTGEVDRLLAEIGRQTARISDLEDLVDLLRKALDKHLMRESAIASACELLIALAALVADPTPAMLRIRDRAQQLLEDARAQTTTKSEGQA